MSPVDFKKCQCRMPLSLIKFTPMTNVEYKKKPCHMSLHFLTSSVSHVKFKKLLCRPVEFKGRGPFGW